MQKLGFINSSVLIFCIWSLFGCCTLFNIPAPNRNLQEVTLQGTGNDKILVVPIDGIISDEVPSNIWGMKGDSMIAKTVSMLKKASQDSKIKGVILKIDSPGGTVTGSDQLYKEVLGFKKQTGLPIVSLFVKIAASGGYYVAMASDYIVAEPTNITGSIGVVMQNLNAKEGLEKIGVKDQSIVSGKNKAIGSAFREMTPEQQQILQSVVTDLYSRFFEVVTKGRKNLTADQIRPLADGRIYTAKQAEKNGLVDKIGYLEDAVTSVMQRPEYKKTDGNSDPQVIVYTTVKRDDANIYQIKNEGPVSNGMLDTLSGRFERKFMYLWMP
ncbi:MAG: signal peptide peptidase SppA [Leptospiraceae bacterium]|nr:signal peptide peptidase SppA [Leptospiraceae bacterium]MCP5496256.1 signal peptide peptidase SppA [Leptospiraceae bacterium]